MTNVGDEFSIAILNVGAASAIRSDVSRRYFAYLSPISF